MSPGKNILIIIGSAGKNSSNLKLAEYIREQMKDEFNISIFSDLKTLPHFDPELSVEKPPAAIMEFRKQVEKADGILISTPEYVFSIPSGLKNAIEWCVSTTIFSEKPTALLTASADGKKGHEELQLIMRTIMANFTKETTLLIPGIKGKINPEGRITDVNTEEGLKKFIAAFSTLMQTT